MGDGKSADFGLPLLGGLGDGDDCLMNGLLRTVPMLHLPRLPRSLVGMTVVGDEVLRVGIGIGIGIGMGMGIEKDSKKSCKHQHRVVNLKTRPRENGANQSGTRVQAPTQSKGKPDIMSVNS